MRTTLPWASPALLLALTLGCAQETPSKKAAGAPAAMGSAFPIAGLSWSAIQGKKIRRLMESSPASTRNRSIKYSSAT